MAPIASLRPARLGVPLDMARLDEFCRKWNVIEFALFGSVLREDFGPDSDVDVMVVFDPASRPTLLTLAGMQEELEGVFGRKVDVVTRHGVEQMTNPIRRPEILRTARVIYAR